MIQESNESRESTDQHTLNSPQEIRTSIKDDSHETQKIEASEEIKQHEEFKTPKLILAEPPL